jgi:gp16 family phage-associated protein
MATKSAEQVKQEFRQRGQTLAQFAKDNGWQPRDVYCVVAGVFKGRYGRSHEIAVALGMKEPMVSKGNSDAR